MNRGYKPFYDHLMTIKIASLNFFRQEKERGMTVIRRQLESLGLNRV